MPKNILAQIKDNIRQRKYDMSAHATEEMAEDNLDILDIEHAILNGHLARIEKDDPRGTKYVIEGVAVDQVTPVGVVGRFTGDERYLIITVYEITDIER
jgi:hypothetical protein